jgi:hypothetical protein
MLEGGGISGPKMVEVTGGWRKSGNVELHNVYSLPGIVWIIYSI